jgi:hypothetical protein
MFAGSFACSEYNHPGIFLLPAAISIVGRRKKLSALDRKLNSRCCELGLPYFLFPPKCFKEHQTILWSAMKTKQVMGF